MFQQGDLVFAKCTKPWPAKIIKVFNETTFKVDFYNHNSFAIVDHGDLEFLNQTSIQYYREKYKRKKSNQQILALQGIRLAQIQFKRRENIQRIESKKWIQGVPNANQKKQLQNKMKKQIRRPVYKPKQPQKKQQIRGKKSLQQKEKQVKSKMRQGYKIEGIINREQSENVIKTRSKSAKNENESITSKQNSKQKLRDSSKQKSAQIKQKDKPKSKKIKKGSKKKMSYKQKKYKKMRQKLQKNQTTSQLHENKIEAIKNQCSNSVAKEEKEIQQQNLHNSQENICNSTSLMVENESYVSLPEVQKSQEITISAQIIQEQGAQNKFCSYNIQQMEKHQIYEFPNLYVHQNKPEIEKNNKKQVLIENHKIQQFNPIVELNPNIQNTNLINQEEREQINTKNSQVIALTNPLQDQLHNQMQTQQTFQEGYCEQNIENKTTCVNNLDLSASSLEVSLSELHSQSQDNGTQIISLQQQREQLKIFLTANQQINFKAIQEQLQPRQINPFIEEQAVINQNQQRALVLTDNIPQQVQSNYQNRGDQIDESSSIQKNQYQNNLQSLNQPIQEKNNVQTQSAEDENSQKCDQNQTFQKLAPEAPNLLFNIINNRIPVEQPLATQNINLEEHPKTVVIQQKQAHVQQAINLIQNQQKQPASVNSSIIANNISNYEADLKDVRISSDTLQERDNTCKYFQRIYGDFTINNRDYIKMVRGLPELKKQLYNADCKLIAICTNQYLKILSKFIAPQNSQKQMKNLQMWQRQLLIAILDTDTLNLKILVQYEIMFNMMSFITAFQQNRTSKRAQCHVQYLFVVNRLDTYLNRYIKQRFKEGLMHKASSYDQLIRQFNKMIES